MGHADLGRFRRRMIRFGRLKWLAGVDRKSRGFIRRPFHCDHDTGRADWNSRLITIQLMDKGVI
jgi:hypothetical protein